MLEAVAQPKPAGFDCRKIIRKLPQNYDDRIRGAAKLNENYKDFKTHV
jgi:hypothetical protein